MYWNIQKIEDISGEITSSLAGYVPTESDKNYINANHDYNDYLTWIETNKQDLIDGVKTLNEYFVGGKVVYGFYSMTSYIEGLNNTMITNLDTIE